MVANEPIYRPDMNTPLITSILNPRKLIFGVNSFDQFVEDFISLGWKRLYLLSIKELREQLAPGLQQLVANGIAIEIDESVQKEPSFQQFEEILLRAKNFKADSIVGIGGGSVLDVAKLVAAQLHNTQATAEVIGIGNLKERKTYLACLPSTSGTGSEVSPNSILVDENSNKIGVISEYLVPDAAYIDPSFTLSVPRSITAATGIDAMTHCLEAFTNKFAKPMIDLIAIEGVKLVSKHLRSACDNGDDLAAKTYLSLASMYGGQCLGPVNTAGVHALAYPLGTMFHINHGLSIALLLPAVMEFSLVAAPARYAAVAIALGAEPQRDDMQTAKQGVALVKKLISDCGLPTSLSEMDIPIAAVPKMAADAMKVQRLLKNNLREINEADAKNIYLSAF
jgi:alcohol dehydrogenase class IV